MSTDISHLRNLPVAEKLQIIEQLWDDIHDSAKAITLRRDEPITPPVDPKTTFDIRSGPPGK